MTRKQKQTGPEFRDTVATYLSSLVKKRDFAGATAYYETNRSLISQAGGSWAADLLHQVSSAYASLADNPAALKTARAAQAMAAADGDTVLLAEIFITLGETLRNMGQVKEARKAFQDAESIFRRNDHLEGQSRALNQLAGLLFSQADYRNSLRILMDAVEIARKLDDKKKLAYMMGNIGRLYTFMGDLDEAERHLQINIELSSELGDDLETAKAYLSIGYIGIQKGDYVEAEKALTEAYPLIIASGSRRDEAIYYSYLGELQFRSGRTERASESLSKALSIADQVAPESTLVGRITRLMAELCVRTTEYHRARKLAARAMLIAEKAGNKVEIGTLLRIKAQIADALEKRTSALKLYKQALDTLEESGVRFEKAESLVAAGRSESFDLRTRMTYLFRAEEYYSRCHMGVKVNETERLISKLEVARPVSTGVKPPSESSAGVDYLTASDDINRFKAQLPMLGRPDLPILLTGETGVGKDHLARYLHSQVRPDGPYVAINCASVPETLLESELFGYHKGAFTGADSNKPGLLVVANGGILLLDEIGDMPLSLQAKLLGVLEQRKVMPLGSTGEVDIDIILVAASNRNLEQMVEAGSFRRDLYYRLSGVTFRIPPLRERKQDIPLLLSHFMAERQLLPEGSELPPGLVRQFVAYDWPGNIRELENKVKRLQVMADMVAEGDLEEISRSLFADPDDASGSEALSGSLFDRVEQFERKLITEALLAAGGNKSQAARLLGVHEATVRTKLKRYGISLGIPSTGGGAPN
ncbi:MAG: sigma 54-interacting transcriptional regulator [Candidatus Zixiibacteriota bacterium]|nr:MAG: sigma 54-interacting transcriptional regulator [candidate division Zixibacteria bacterium]